MKQILQRVAFFSFLGCLVVIAIASHGHPHLDCREEWKGALVQKEAIKGSLVESNTHDNSYALHWPGKIFKLLID